VTHLFRRLRSWSPPNVEALAPALPIFTPQQFSGLDPLGIALVLVLLVLSLGVHEAAHAWSAWKCGDSTAKDLGRMTLNPLPHIDPFMTILLPGFLLLSSHGQRFFGGAKPVPVSFHRLRHPWRDMCLVAIAGPLSNFLLAVFFWTGSHFFVKTGWYNGAAEFRDVRHNDLLPQVLESATWWNLLLAVFNLVPIPPLDGSRVMAYVLPPGVRERYLAIGNYGMLLIFGLLAFSPEANRFMYSTLETLLIALNSMVTLGGRW